MFSFFEKRKIKQLPNTKSLAFGLPMVQKIQHLLDDRNFDAIWPLYDGLTNGEKSLLLDGVALNAKNFDSILEWYNRDPQDWLANLFAGVAYTFMAWEERTGQMAKYVTQNQFRGFFENLNQAKLCLTESSSLQSNEAEVYARLIRVNMGHSDKAGAQTCFDTLMTLDPNHLGGHLFMVNLLAPKWLGSFEEMKAFVEPFRSPQKNDLRYVAFMHFAVQHFVDLSDENYRSAEKIFKKTYGSEIMNAYSQFDIPNMPSLERYYLHNYFSYLFFLLDKKKLRNKEIDLVGNHITFFPWAYAEVEGERDLKLKKFY